MIARRLLETVAMTLIGDSVLCVVSPRRHLSLWLAGPRWWRGTWEPFIRRPTLTRILGLVGIAFGLWLAWSQEPRVARFPSVGSHAQRRGWMRRLEAAAR